MHAKNRSKKLWQQIYLKRTRLPSVSHRPPWRPLPSARRVTPPPRLMSATSSTKHTAVPDGQDIGWKRKSSPGGNWWKKHFPAAGRSKTSQNCRLWRADRRSANPVKTCPRTSKQAAQPRVAWLTRASGGVQVRLCAMAATRTKDSLKKIMRKNCDKKTLDLLIIFYEYC